jgi:hypothetical protein
MKDIGNTVGFKDMHPMQVEAVLEVIAVTLNLASGCGPEVYEEAEDAVDNMVKLLGGNGVTTTVEIY